MTEPSERLEQAEGRFSTGSMKALQIIQTILLMAVTALGGWIGTTTVESSRAIARMEETVRGIGNDNARLTLQIQHLTEEHYALDRRVTTIEARGFK